MSLSETDGNNVYPVRYFRSFDLDDDDVRAVWPAILINTDNAFRKQKASMTRYKSKIQNAVLSVGGPMSRDRWLSRMIIGFVSIYDYKVHLHNIQVAILRARIVPTTESDDQRRFRMRALGALRMSFIIHQAVIIDKLDRSIADARRKSFNAEEHEAMGDFSDATYIDYLNELRTQFAVMDF